MGWPVSIHHVESFFFIKALHYRNNSINKYSDTGSILLRKYVSKAPEQKFEFTWQSMYIDWQALTFNRGNVTSLYTSSLLLNRSIGNNCNALCKVLVYMCHLLWRYFKNCNGTRRSITFYYNSSLISELVTFQVISFTVLWRAAFNSFCLNPCNNIMVNLGRGMERNPRDVKCEEIL
jgi:hypothetical protein